MPDSVFLEYLPLPTLRQYTTVSILLFVSSLFYARNIIIQEHDPAKDVENYLEFIHQDSFCLWSNVNMIYCCFFMLGKIVQRFVFGDLQGNELQHIKDKFWNYIFYKFIFIFGVINAQKLNEVMLWCAWFTLVGFFHLFTQLCQDRFQYLAFSPSASSWVHAKVVALLAVILLCCNILLIICIYTGLTEGLNIFAFMAAECLLLTIKTVHSLAKYIIHLWDRNQDNMWERRSIIMYYTDFSMDLAMLSVDFAHHLHMLLWANIFLSMASLVLCMNLRLLFFEIRKKLRRHDNYVRILNCLNERLPKATDEELSENNDSCAICWDPMTTAHKLPCGHLFHGPCLLSWLEQDTTCPTCRYSMTSELEPDTPDMQGNTERTNRPGTQRNHFFHFDGSRIASWFPSFSVEVVHASMTAAAPPQQQTENSRIEAMAHQLQDIFPHVPMNTIVTDLRHTHSVEITTENILESLILVPAVNNSTSEEESLETSTSESLNQQQQMQDNERTDNVERTDATDELDSHEQAQQDRMDAMLPKARHFPSQHEMTDSAENSATRTPDSEEQNYSIRQRVLEATEKRLQNT